MNEPQMEALLAEQRDQQKQTHGAWAMTVFIIVSAYYHIANGTLFTLGALAWFAVGIFASALILGIVAYALQQTVAALTPKRLTQGVRTFLAVMGVVLFLVNTVVAVFLTRAVYNWLY